VGREDELDAQRSHGLAPAVARQAGSAPARERIGTRARLGPVAAVARIVAAPPDAVMLFGDVGQREEVRERPARSARPPRIGSSQRRSASSSKARLVAGVRALRERADLLDARRAAHRLRARRSVSPSSSPSSRTSSRSGFCVSLMAESTAIDARLTPSRSTDTTFVARRREPSDPELS
jgi:hypothetical protein